MIFSIIFFHESPTPVNYVGMVIAVLAFMANSYLKINEKKAKTTSEEQQNLLSSKKRDAEAAIGKIHEILKSNDDMEGIDVRGEKIE